MKKQAGFTLVEIAIVLVIIGLLLGGVLKGQELINSAKVKNFATDFRNIPLFIYGYQDKFRALPGDDAGVDGTANGRFGTTGTPCAPAAADRCAVGNGVIDGVWNAASVVDESFVFWQHVRLAGLAAGPTVTTDPNYRPRNADGGFIGIESGSAATGGAFISGLTPTYLVCSAGILGRFAKQLDITLDDGNAQTGSLRVVQANHTRGQAALDNASVLDSNSYVVCMGL